jgi:type IV pilus assembly protein PilQ
MKNKNTSKIRLFMVFLMIGNIVASCSTMDEEDGLDEVSVGSFQDFQDNAEEGEGKSSTADKDLEEDEASQDEFADSNEGEQESKTAEADLEEDEASQDEFADSNEGKEQTGSDSKQTAQNQSEFDEFSEPQFDQSENESNLSEQAPSSEQTQVAESQEELPPVTENMPEVDIPVTEDTGLSPEPSLQTESTPAPEMVPLEPQTANVGSVETPKSVTPWGSRVRVTDMQYRVNDQGGTFIIQANGPIEFNQKLNPQTNQLVIELSNAQLPKKLQRPFNTKDFPGQIGYIDAYQMKGASPRIVIQLREGAASEPIVQNEGNALYIIAQGNVTVTGQQMTLSANETGGETLNAEISNESQSNAEDVMESSLFASENFEDFLRSNQKFSGKRISIETDEMELRDIFKLISEEAEVNLVLADDVKGKMSLKLKNVPWDQALVMLMKAKKLGYTRSGSILRVAPMTELRSEEEDAIRIETAKRNNEPPLIKNITINYAKVEELERQIRPLLSSKGSVVGDPRTSSIIVTDLEENIKRAETLVKALDIPPQQVLIEGRIVEAMDNFERQFGINWAASGRPVNISSGANGPIRFTPGLSVTPGAPSASTLGLNFALGTLDVLGDLTASLRLFELQGVVKVISSPRILTLHNETAEIIQTTEIPLITSNIQPNGATTPIVNFKPAQLKLSVIPQVTNDGSIILGVDLTREVPGEVVDTQTNARPVNSRSAKTKVLLKNSQTAVIGGIYQNDSTESEGRVPGMAKIPVIGWLFKNKSIDRKRTELLIFLTPRILGQMQSLPTAVSTPALPDGSPQDDLIKQGSSNSITVESDLDMVEKSGEVQDGKDSYLDAEFGE